MIIKEKWFKTVVLTTVLTCFLYSLSIYMPLIGGFISFFSPLPLGVVRVRYSKLETYIALVSTCFLLFFIGGKLGVFLFLIQYGLPFLMFIEFFLFLKEPYYSMIISSVFLIVIFYLVLLFFANGSFAKINLILQTYIEKSINISFKNYSGGLSKAELIEITAKLKKTVGFLLKILPAMMFGFYSAVMLGNFYILKRIVGNFQKVELIKFKNPFFIVWIFIVSGFFILFFKKSILWYIFLNLFVITSFLFLIQGLCIVEYWFKKYNISTLMRVFFILALFVFQFIFIFIAVLGLFDVWFDYRKLNFKEEANESNS